MNRRKNGIFIDTHPKTKKEKYKLLSVAPCPYKLFATLTRLEDGHIVWITTPYLRKEINKLVSEGWHVVETWEPVGRESELA